VLSRDASTEQALVTLSAEAEAGLEVPSTHATHQVVLALAHRAQESRAFPHVLELLMEQCQQAHQATDETPAQEGEDVLEGAGVFAAYLRFRGPDNPAILAARESLIGYLNSPQHRPAAATVLHGLVSDCGQLLGSGHPFTQRAREHLARFLALTGDPNATGAAFEALGNSCAPHLDADDPAIRDSLRAGVTLFLGGRVSPTAGCDAVETLLADCLEAFGPEHPVVVAGRDLLACLQRGRMDPAPPAQMLEAPLADCLRTFGPEHPVTLTLRNHVVHLLAEAASPAACAGALKALLADCLRALGPDDFLTQQVDRMLGYWLVRTPSAPGA